jgi:hypothetical protein
MKNISRTFIIMALGIAVVTGFSANFATITEASPNPSIIYRDDPPAPDAQPKPPRLKANHHPMAPAPDPSPAPAPSQDPNQNPDYPDN